MEMNNIKNQLTGEYGPVPDTARHYKVSLWASLFPRPLPLPWNKATSVQCQFYNGHANIYFLAILFFSTYRQTMYPGWLSGMPTMAREAVGSMLLWSQGTLGVWPLLSRALHVSMVISAITKNIPGSLVIGTDFLIM